MAKYHPLYYLSALGAAGLSVAFWKLGDVTEHSLPLVIGQFFFLALAYILFVLNLGPWLNSLKESKLFGLFIPTNEEERKRIKEMHPVVATGWMAMPAALAMILNATFAVLPTYFPLEMEAIAPIGFVVWLISFGVAALLGVQIMLNTFAVGSSIKEFHFGILLQPLAFGLNAIPGMVMSAYLPKMLSDFALIGGLTAFSIGGMLGALAFIFLFHRFLEYGMPDVKAAPATLIIIPSISVYTIFVLKLFHLLKEHFHTEVAYAWWVLVSYTGIGLMAAATLLGLLVLYAYFKKKVPFSPAWWGFVCPFVAMSVLSSVVYQVSKHNLFFLASAVVTLAIAVGIYFYVGKETWKLLRQQ